MNYGAVVVGHTARIWTPQNNFLRKVKYTHGIACTAGNKIPTPCCCHSSTLQHRTLIFLVPTNLT